MKPVKAWGMFVKGTDKLAAVWWDCTKDDAKEIGDGDLGQYNSEELEPRRVVITLLQKPK